MDVSNCDRSIKVFSVNPPLIFAAYRVSSLLCMITLFLKLYFCFADDKHCVKFYEIKLFYFLIQVRPLIHRPKRHQVSS